MTVRVTCKRV